MSVIYGADYSAREFSPQELSNFTQYSLKFLMRYIGYPSNPKCISHYPGAFAAHEAAGRTVLLTVENQTYDPRGGFLAGVAMANLALKDARSIGYPENRPIFFCSDAWLSSNGISVATAMAYLDGAASVLGVNRVGAYGFRDFVVPARQGNHARYIWLCGSAPTDAEVAANICDIYQSNQGFISVGSPLVECDLNWAYVNPAHMVAGNLSSNTQQEEEDMAGFWFIGKQSDPGGVALLYPNGDFVGVSGSNWSAVVAANGIPKLDVPDEVWDDMRTRFSGYGPGLAKNLHDAGVGSVTVTIQNTATGESLSGHLEPVAGESLHFTWVPDAPTPSAPTSGSTS
jgi:hypothetical protein